MIVIINSDGSVKGIQDEDLFQGSTNFNYIDLIAPFSDSVTFKAMFEMPDGTYKPENLDGYVFTPSLNISDDFNAWRLPITFPITQDYGIVNMQIRGMVSNSIVCTTSVKIPIQKGVPYASDFEELSDKDQLLQMIADLRALLSNKVDKVNYALQVADVDRYTVGTYFVYDSTTEEYIPKILPQDYESGVQYYSIKNTGKVVNNNDGLSLKYEDNETEESTEVKVLKDKVTINNKKVATEDDLTAENISYDNNTSEMDSTNTQDAIDEMSAEIRRLKFSQTIDLGDIEIPSSAWQLVSGIYQYEFTNQKFTDANTQSIIVTPNADAIDLLNSNDILIYPEIQITQSGSSAVATIKADKKPSFSIVANFKIVSVIPDGTVSKIYANTVVFNGIPDEFDPNNVQSAIIANHNDLKTYKTNNDTAVELIETDITKIKNGETVVNRSQMSEYSVHTTNHGLDESYPLRISSIKKSLQSGLIVTGSQDLPEEYANLFDKNFDDFIISSRKSMLSSADAVNSEIPSYSSSRLINNSTSVNIALSKSTPFRKGSNQYSVSTINDCPHPVLEFRLIYSEDNTTDTLYNKIVDYVKVKIPYNTYTYTFAYTTTNENGEICVFSIQFKLNEGSTTRTADMQILSGYNITTQTSIANCYVYVDNIFSVIE